MKDIALNRQTHGLAVRLTPYGLDLRSVDGREQTAQQMKIALLTLLGEWYQDTTKGIPYFQEVMVKGPNLKTVESVFRQRLMAIGNVSLVRNLTLSTDQRTRYLQVGYECDTLYGSISDVIDAPLTRGT